MRQVLHIDMDAFYASVEQHDRPELAGKPVVVGGRSRRGVVAAASYEVRRFGVHSAMPMVQAVRLCPEAVVVEPRMDRYAEVSRSVFEVLRSFTPLVEGLSLDEAFLDVTASSSLFGDGPTIARSIKQRIVETTGLRASAGVADCKFVAKIASDLEKPDGLVVVPHGGNAAFLAPLPIRRMWGIGPKTAPRLLEAGLTTLGELARAPRATVEPLLGRWAAVAQALARGVDPRPVEPDREVRSIGAEETYERDLIQRPELERALLDLCARVAERALRQGVRGKTVVLKVKFADFRLVTRRVTSREAVCDTSSLFEAARGLLDALDPRAPVRLLGASLTGLVAASAQRPLFTEGNDRREALERVRVQVLDRFGRASMTRASLLEPGSTGRHHR